MSIYSGSSPFARNKLGNAKMSRGGSKKKLAKLARRRNANREQLTGSTSAGGKGVTMNWVGLPSGQDKYMKAVLSQAQTALSGLGEYDGLGIHASKSKGGHLYFTMKIGNAVPGYDNGGSANAISLLKDIKITISLDGVVHEGLIGQTSSGTNWKIEFPTVDDTLAGGVTINYFRFEYS